VICDTVERDPRSIHDAAVRIAGAGVIGEGDAARTDGAGAVPLGHYPKVRIVWRSGSEPAVGVFNPRGEIPSGLTIWLRCFDSTVLGQTSPPLPDPSHELPPTGCLDTTV
jgi:hypothetical protein